MIKRALILAVVGAAALGALMLFTYDVLKVDWIGFMEVPGFFPADGRAAAGAGWFGTDRRCRLYPWPGSAGKPGGCRC